MPTIFFVLFQVFPQVISIILNRTTYSNTKEVGSNANLVFIYKPGRRCKELDLVQIPTKLSASLQINRPSNPWKAMEVRGVKKPEFQ